MQWQPIETFGGKDYEKVDLYLHIYPSPRSMGFSDSFRVIEAYRIDEEWFHIHNGKQMKIEKDYITHWMPMPESPNNDESLATKTQEPIPAPCGGKIP